LNLEKTKSFLSQYYHIIVIVVILIVFSLYFLNYIKNNTAIPIGDALNHLSIASRVFRVTRGELPTQHIRDLQYPPLVYFISCLFFRIFGFEPQNALFTQYIFSLVFLLALYGLGSSMGEKIGGIAVLLLGSISPYFIIWGRRYLLDMPAAAMILLSLWLLIRSDNFKKTGYSILFGIATALSLWIKWSCIVFILPPFLILFIVQGIKNRKSGLILLFSVIASALPGMYYLNLGKTLAPGNIESFMVISRFHYILFSSIFFILLLGFIIFRIMFRKRFEEGKGIYSVSAFNAGISLFIAQLLVYPIYLISIKPYFVHFAQQREFMKRFDFGGNLITNLYSVAWSFPLAILLIIVGIVFIFISPKKFLESGLLFSSLIVGLLITTASSPPARKYILPAVGICVVFGGYWIGLVRRWFSIPLISILFIISMLPYYSYFYSVPVFSGVPPIGTGREKMTGYLFNPLPYKIPPPDRGDYHIKDVVTCITDHYQKYIKGRSKIDIITIKPFITDDFVRFSQKKNLREVRNDFLDFALGFYGDRKEHYYIIHENLLESIRRDSNPIYGIMFYVEPVEVRELYLDVQKSSKRELWELISYPVPGKRRIGAVYIHILETE